MTSAGQTERDSRQRAAVLQEALPYIRKHQGTRVVIKYGGAAMTTPHLRQSFARDVALLRLVGLRPIVVHGGGKEVSAWSERLGLDVRFESGLRVTDASTMEIAKMVLVGKVNKQIVAGLELAGAPAVGLAGEDGGLISARKHEGDVDLGFVGEIERVNPAVLESLADFVPVVASVGLDSDGQSLNINADTVAGAVAAAVSAPRVIFMTDVAGLLADARDPESLIIECTRADVQKLRASGKIGDGMIPKLDAVEFALAAGVSSATIIDGRGPHNLLLEFFTERGSGTMIRS